jgi:dihydroxyacetone kinase-like protein
MSTGVMYGGRALGPVDAVDAAGLARFWRGFADGIAKRGKCRRGDRTILDAIGEAADRAEAALAADPSASLEAVARASLDGAEAGVEKTKTMVPKFGKAAVFSDKILGSPDQGAVAGMYLVSAFCGYICGE